MSLILNFSTKNSQNMEKSVQIFVIINFLVIGVSHLFQPHIWVDFFKFLRKYGNIGIFAYSFLSLSFGSIILAFHWVWEGIAPSIITFFGVAQVIKSLIGFTIPEYSLKSISRPIAENPNSYRVGGAVFLILAIFFILAF